MNILRFDTISMIINLNIGIFSVIVLMLIALNTMHAFQLSNYRVREYAIYFKSVGYSHLRRQCYLSFLSLVGMIIYYACFGQYEIFRYIGFVFFAALSAIFVALNTNRDSKTPLKYTSRVKRQLIVMGLLWAAIVFVVLFVLPALWSYIIIGALPVIVIPVVIASGMIIRPLESILQRGFIAKAKSKLMQRDKLIVIGITGSYGKTTTKNILHTMLSAKYKVCASPANYNTPMGICKTVNEYLKDDDEVLILEMGARYRHDIRELVGIAKLDYAIITCVGDAHIQSFKTTANILDTKCDIITGLKDGGVAVVDGTNDRIKSKLKDNANVYCVGGYNDYAYCDNIVVSSKGTSFDINVDGNRLSASTRLLGRHIASNATMCAALAYKMGVGLESIASSIDSLEPVPHRLELLQGRTTDTIVIDDSYNANLQGITYALEVVDSFDDYCKIIITPGVVELGEHSASVNERVGLEIGRVCDYAFLIGSNSEYINQGISRYSDDNNGGRSCRVAILDDRDSALVEIIGITGAKVVLFANDLPDNIK